MNNETESITRAYVEAYEGTMEAKIGRLENAAYRWYSNMSRYNPLRLVALLIWTFFEESRRNSLSEARRNWRS